MATEAAAQYERDGVVCPFILRKDLFTAAAIDNIDHNRTSNTAGQSFHGTDISMFRNRTSQSDGTKRERQPEGTSQSSRKYSLPEYYTNVTPASLVTNNQSFSPVMFFLQRMITFWNLPLRMNMSGLKKHGSNEVKLSAWRIQFHGLPTMGTYKLRIEHPQSMPSYPCFQMTPNQLE